MQDEYLFAIAIYLCDLDYYNGLKSTFPEILCRLTAILQLAKPRFMVMLFTSYNLLYN